MKKAGYLLLIIGACLILGGVVILNQHPQTLKARELTKIGVVMNGSFADRSYTQAQYDGLAEAAANVGVKIDARDNVPVDDDFPTLVGEMIANGCEVIVCDNYLYDDYLLALAEEYPAIEFYNGSGTVTAENLSSYLGRLYQVRYLAGIVAGAQTQTNEIGYVLAFLTPETVRQLNAFTIGVKKANPDATVYVRCTEDWNDGEKAAAVTTALLDAHDIDVLSQHVNPLSPMRVADERGVYTVGSNVDNRAQFPDTCLTCCVFNWEPFFAARIDEIERNRSVGKHYWEGVRTGMVALAPLSDAVSEETKQIVDAELERLLGGSYDVFFGPVTDNTGVERVHAGENLSDAHLLYEMNWFVDGVVME